MTGPADAPRPPRLRFPKLAKLRSPREFARVYDGGRRAGDGVLLVFGAENGAGVTRVGLSVSRKHGGAVRRNVKKRRLREAFRLSRPDLPPGWDLILIPRHGDPAAVERYRASLLKLAGKLAGRRP